MPRRILLLTLAVLTVASQGTLGRAAADWEDESGDATALPEMESSPRPSDAELDILLSSYSVSGDSIVASTQLEAIGEAPGSGGSVYQFHFHHKGQRYYLQSLTGSPEYSQLFLGNPRFYRANDDPAGDPEELRCDCKATVDQKTKTATFSIKTSGVAKALKASVGAITLEGLEVRTFRRLYTYLPADTSVAPEALKLQA